MSTRTLVLVELDEDAEAASFTVRRFHEEPIDVLAYAAGKVYGDRGGLIDGMDGASLFELAKLLNRR